MPLIQYNVFNHG